MTLRHKLLPYVKFKVVLLLFFLIPFFFLWIIFVYFCFCTFWGKFYISLWNFFCLEICFWHFFFAFIFSYSINLWRNSADIGNSVWILLKFCNDDWWMFRWAQWPVVICFYNQYSGELYLRGALRGYPHHASDGSLLIMNGVGKIYLHAEN